MKHHSEPTLRDFLYEPPGPHSRRRIQAGTAISLVALVALIYMVIRQFAVNGQLAARYWSFYGKVTTWKFIGQGLAGTVEVALAAGAIAFVLGLLLMLGRRSRYKVLNVISVVLVEFSRGVPTLLFIYFFLLVVPQLGIQLPSFLRITIPVAISAAGVVAEVLRSGMNAVPHGQTEAALSLGMTDWHAFRKIVFPQGMRYVVPALISEMVIVLKDTTFAYVINYADLMQNAKVLISNYDALLSVYLVVALIYILINYALNQLAAYVERRTRTPQAGKVR